MIKNVKMQVTEKQTRLIQHIVFKNNGCWVNKTKSINWLIVDAEGDLSWATTATLKCYSEISAEDWLRDALCSFPIYKMYKYQNFIVRFNYFREGEVVWVKSNSDTVWNVGDIRNDWASIDDDSVWKNVENIDLFTGAVDNNIEEHADELTYKPFTEPDESASTEKEITQGTIVQATRKSTSEKHKDYIWQGVYFGYCNGKHLIDANSTHVMLADEVSVIPTLTKKEAKQKISELFANPKNVSSEKVRNIIDLIKI